MIPDIQEINFPSYATINSAEATLSDMGEKTITAHVSIDGSITPSFIGRTGTTAHGSDWEIEFQGERYIQPLRTPQSAKGNESICSQIDLTFVHWAIHQLKRYYFFTLPSVSSGTAIADKYVSPITVDLPKFAKALDDILAYYFPDRSIYVYKSGNSYINPDLHDYDTSQKTIEIDYSYLWDVLLETYNLFDCHWSIEVDANGKYMIKFGYPTYERSTPLQYGYEGGCTRVERVVEDQNIRNSVMGRGAEKNLPLLYFKDYERFHPDIEDISNNGQTPDPDAIPELEDIYFDRLRDSNFRSYVQGWKVNPNRIMSTEDGWYVVQDGDTFTESDGTTYSYDAQRAEEDWAYAKGHTDTEFNPVEDVRDEESIETYGMLQGAIEDDETIFPSLQGMKISVPCATTGHSDTVTTDADKIVAVEQVVTDEIESSENEPTSETVQEFITETLFPEVHERYITDVSHIYYYNGASATIRIKVEEGISAYLSKPSIKTYFRYQKVTSISSEGSTTRASVEKELIGQPDCNILVYPINTNGEREQYPVSGNALKSGEYDVVIHWEGEEISLPYSTIVILNSEKFATYASIQLISMKFNGYISDISNTFGGTISENSESTFVQRLGEFNFDDDSERYAIYDIPISVTNEEFAIVEKTPFLMELIDGQEDGDPIYDLSNITAGEYNLYLKVSIANTSTSSKQFQVTTSNVQIYRISQEEGWKPTFDIWIKNIFGTNRRAFQGGTAGDEEYVRSVWEPLIGTQEATVLFSSGNLSSHSDWEFKIAKDGIHYDTSKTVLEEGGHAVSSEWRLTLIKSDAERDTIHKYVPYKDFNARIGDTFYLVNIYMPWSYVFAAEAELNAKKSTVLTQYSETHPQWNVSLDKVYWYNNKEAFDQTFRVGNKVILKDSRFTSQSGVGLFIEGISYSWQQNPQTGLGLPEVNLTLTDKVATTASTVEQIQGDIEEISSQVRTISDLERTIRKVADRFYLRKDGVEDTSYSPTSIARVIRSQNYSQTAGWSFSSDSDGNSIGYIDKLYIRKELHVSNLVVDQISAEGGKSIMSAAAITVNRVEIVDYNNAKAFKCYFDNRGGTVMNLFAVNDIAMSQVFSPDGQVTKYYRRLVLDVGANYIVLSANQGEYDGDGEPSENDVIVQYGNTTNTSRRYAILRDVIGGGHERMLSGLSSVTSQGTEYYFAGISGNSGPRWFVGNSSANEYAEYFDGELTVSGKIIVKSGSSGMNQFSEYSALNDELTRLGEVLGDGETVTSITGGAVLSTIIGVQSGGSLKAALNASSLGSDNTHGVLMLFAGATDSSSASSAKFRVYQDGYVVAENLKATGANITGELRATGGRIGPFMVSGPNDYDGLGAINDTTYYPDTLMLNLSASGIEFTTNDVNSAYNMALVMGTVPASTTGEQIGFYSRIKRSGDAFVRAFNTCFKAEATGDYAHNIAFDAVSGMFKGFRPYIRIQNTTDSLRPDDCVIYCENSSEIDLSLPTTPQDGQFYIILHMSVSNIRVIGRVDNSSPGHQIRIIRSDNWLGNIADFGRGTYFFWYSASLSQWVATYILL